MEVKELVGLYKDENKTQEIANQLQQIGSKIALEGLVGSSAALVAAGLAQHVQDTHVFILEDKDKAAYFLNDLQSLLPTGFKILFFPASFRVPYQVEETENANIQLRAEVLNELNKRLQRTLIVTYPEALTEKVVTKKHLKKNTLEVEVGKAYSLDFINELLIEFEFDKVDYVYEPGQFSVRGGIVDVFSFSNDHPFRIEFFGDDVDSIRTFDPVDQLSLAQHKKIEVIPNVQQKLMRENREGFLQFLGDQVTLWLENYQVVIDAIGKAYTKAEEQFEKLDSPLQHLPPHEIFTSQNELRQQFIQNSIIEFGGDAFYDPDLALSYNLQPQPSFNKNFDLLIENLQAYQDKQFANLVFSAQSKQIERIYKIFEDKETAVKFVPIPCALQEGFVDRDLKLTLYTDHQIFERYHRFRLKEGFKKNKQALSLKEIYNLQKGDFVVHVDHGVGKFSGLEKIDVNGKPQEAIRLVYKDNDVLYVSIHSLHRISKYTGKDGTPPAVNKIGSPKWNNLKKKAKSKVKELAFDLIKLYAKRKAKKGFAYSPDSYLQNELEASFIYEDTPDQYKATQKVKEDMEAGAPMDRLVCGDVGFGKTEIAIRAAFKAATDGKQVAVLVPTTILSLQHYNNFSNRLKEFPVTVDYINRFKSRKANKETLEKLKEGKVDILIGTHKLVSKEVVFQDLGLMIIDEEQKFGVSVKDKLKTIKANVDTLTLTATPIPRTLQFSLMGARDLSIISTPPPNRQPVHTEVQTFSEEVIRDAVSHEVTRGGQVYFVHNRVQNIKEVAGMIQRLCPGVRIGIGHGQMEGDKLEEVMMAFIEGEYDVLLATTIIESGIDIPNANTMIIHNAQNFGLSDLHQLRGRVGRSNKKAFCYLICPPKHSMTAEARKRLDAIAQFSDLGSGFNIAMKDLDIRGAGNLLGGEQSGFIADVGIEMYQRILNEALEELKENEFKDLFKDQQEEKEYVKECQLETDFELLLPDDYVNNVAERLALYRELDDIETEDGLKQYEENLTDRFGALPDQVIALIDTIRLRWLAKDIGFEKLVLKSGKMLGYFIAKSDSPFYQSPKFARIIQYIQRDPSAGKLSEKNDKLRLIYNDIDSIAKAKSMLQKVANQEQTLRP